MGIFFWDFYRPNNLQVYFYLFDCEMDTSDYLFIVINEGDCWRDNSFKFLLTMIQTKLNIAVAELR